MLRSDLYLPCIYVAPISCIANINSYCCSDTRFAFLVREKLLPRKRGIARVINNVLFREYASRVYGGCAHVVAHARIRIAREREPRMARPRNMTSVNRYILKRDNRDTLFPATSRVSRVSFGHAKIMNNLAGNYAHTSRTHVSFEYEYMNLHI